MIEGQDIVVFGRSWMDMTGNIACLLYATRDVPLSGRSFYGHIKGMGEVVHEIELEPC